MNLKEREISISKRRDKIENDYETLKKEFQKEFKEKYHRKLMNLENRCDRLESKTEENDDYEESEDIDMHRCDIAGISREIGNTISILTRE